MDSAAARKTIFILILLVAVATRFWGLGWGLPQNYHIDEAKFGVTAVDFFVKGLNPHFFHVPTLHMYMLAGLWEIYRQVGHLTGQFPTLRDFRIYYIEHPETYLLIGRVLSAVLSIGTVLLVFLLGLRMYNLTVATGASLFLLFSLEHLTNSHAMMPDVPMLFFMVLSMVFIWGVYRTGQAKYYLLTGLTAGAAMAMKYGGQMMFLPLFLAHLFHVLENGQPKRKIIFHLPLYLAGLVFLAVFVAGTPYSLLDSRKFLKDFKWQVGHLQAEGHFGSSMEQPAWLFYLQYGFAYNIGRWAQFLAFGGIFMALARRKAREIILLAYPLVLLAMIGTWKTRATRYLLPIAPFLILAAAAFADAAGRAAGARLDKRRAAKAGPGRRLRLAGALPVALILVAAAPSVVEGIRYDRSAAETDTRTQARDWIHFNIPEESRVALENYGPPISRGRYSVLYWHALGQGITLDCLARQQRAEYAVISDPTYARFTRYPKDFPGESAFYFQLDEEGALLKTFAPSFDPELLDLHSPIIKIYRIGRTPNFRFPGHFPRFAQDVKLEKSPQGDWVLSSELRTQGWVEAGERVRWPYVRIADALNKTVARLELFADEIPAGPDFEIAAETRLKDLPASASVIIGYEYGPAPNLLRQRPERPMVKEFKLPGRVGEESLLAGGYRAFYRYAALPESEGAGFQSAAVLERGSRSEVWSRLFGGALGCGDTSVLNPYLELRDGSGAPIGKLMLARGKVGTYFQDRPAPVENAAELPLPAGPLRLLIGHDGVTTGAKPDAAGPPFSLELPPLLVR